MRRLASQVARWPQPRPSQRTPHLLPPLVSRRCRSTRQARARVADAAIGEKQNSAVGEKKNRTKLRIFEQDSPGSETRTELDPEIEDHGEIKAIYAEIQKLDKEIKDFEDDPFGPESPFIQALPEDERVKFLEDLRKSKEAKQLEVEKQGDAEEYQAPDTTVEEESPKQIEKVRLRVSLRDQRLLDKFNYYLERASNGEKLHTDADDLWLWYTRCKSSVPYFLDSIPRSAWNAMWDVQSEISPVSVRSAHLIVLSEDILNSTGILTPLQSLTYIECLDFRGQKEKAIEIWNVCEIDLEEESDTVTDYLSLGLRLYSAHGDLKEAKTIARKLFKRQGIRDYRSAKPTILAQSKIEGDNGAKQAWTTYLQLKQGLGQKMNMEDYDDISIGFLKSGRAELALAVFKDMMLSQQTSKFDSTMLYETSLKQLNKMQSSADNEPDLNHLSLGALTLLPRQFQNKFFYGSWLKKLIGMQEVEAAAMVVDLMFERGVMPDARHLNGIIGAWLRLGDHSSKRKAEDMGWAMIRARIDFVTKRNNAPPRPSLPQLTIRDPSSIDDIKGFTVPAPLFVRRTVPRATIETFALLTLFYSRRTMDHVVEHLLYCLKLAEIPPNSFLVNHLLFAQLRKHDLQAVTKIYQTMSPAISPDLETFACLWECSKLHNNKIKEDINRNDFPTPRSLYRDMLAWLARLSPRDRNTVNEQFSKELYDQIIVCFCFSRDLQGTLVALQSLKSLFNMYPNQNTASVILHRIAMLLPVNYALLPSRAGRRRLRRFSGNPEHRTNLQKVADTLKTIRDRRVDALTATGAAVVEGDELEEQVLDEVTLGSLVDLVMASLWKVIPAKDKPASLRRRFEEAAEEMGCDVDWFEEAFKSTEVLIEDGVV